MPENEKKKKKKPARAKHEAKPMDVRFANFRVMTGRTSCKWFLKMNYGLRYLWKTAKIQMDFVLNEEEAIAFGEDFYMVAYHTPRGRRMLFGENVGDSPQWEEKIAKKDEIQESEVPWDKVLVSPSLIKKTSNIPPISRRVLTERAKQERERIKKYAQDGWKKASKKEMDEINEAFKKASKRVWKKTIEDDIDCDLDDLDL